MKSYFRIGTMLLAALVFASGLKAQQRLKMDLGYSINQPTGQFKETVNTTSYRGLQGGLTYDVTEQLGIGLGFSFADFYEKKPRQVYQTGEGAISAVVSNSIQVTPIVAKASYQ